MNIMDLRIGETGVSEHGIRYRIVRDDVERRPGFGRVIVRIAEDDHGRIHKFMRGIDVTRGARQ